MAKMTIDKLATIIKQEFDNVYKHFNKRLDGIEDDIDILKTGVASTNTTLKEIQEEITTIKFRLTNLEKRTIENDDAINQELLKLKHRIDLMENQIKELKTAHS